MMAPFLYPQLYRCPSPAAVNNASLGSALSFEPSSQSGEDLLLWRRIFSAEGAAFAGATYVEIGAYDGSTFSNTRVYERLMGARGLLVEAHPHNSVRLRSKQLARPNSAIVTTAVCGLKKGRLAPGSVPFSRGGGPTGTGLESASSEFMSKWHKDESGSFDVDCVPMQSLLDASGLLDVDFFSLGEGAVMCVAGRLSVGCEWDGGSTSARADGGGGRHAHGSGERRPCPPLPFPPTPNPLPW